MSIKLRKEFEKKEDFLAPLLGLDACSFNYHLTFTFLERRRRQRRREESLAGNLSLPPPITVAFKSRRLGRYCCLFFFVRMYVLVLEDFPGSERSADHGVAPIFCVYLQSRKFEGTTTTIVTWSLVGNLCQNIKVRLAMASAFSAALEQPLTHQERLDRHRGRKWYIETTQSVVPLVMPIRGYPSTKTKSREEVPIVKVWGKGVKRSGPPQSSIFLPQFPSMTLVASQRVIGPRSNFFIEPTVFQSFRTL